MSKISDSRRKFIKKLVSGSAAASTSGLVGCGGGGGGSSDDDPDEEIQTVAFRHGVASGDPLKDKVIIWTRLSPDTDGEFAVDWEVASDNAFQSVVNSGSTSTDLSRDYTVKVDADQLNAGSVYYYRFSANGTSSGVGKTKTLPDVGISQIKLAVFSCSNYPAGFFHVYQEAAKRDDLDAVIHLGDYIYEYEKDGFASQDAESLGRVVNPLTELLSVDDYRKRYAQYRTDADLRELHAKVPFIVIWDDHELANNAYITGAENHQPSEGDFFERRANALKAFFEWIPMREPSAGQPDVIYRSFDFGDLLSLHMLDTRIIARDKQLAFPDYIDASGAFDHSAFQTDVSDVNRQLLGVDQTNWLQGQMQQSTSTWQVLGQQVLMGRMAIPAPIATESMSFGDFATLFIKATVAPGTLTEEEQAILAQPSIPYNLDAWDGYSAAREAVLGSAHNLDKNLVVLSGDTHNAWANDLTDIDGNQVGVEFAVNSVSSPGFEASLPDEVPDLVATSFQQFIEPLKFANTQHRGYMILSVNATEAESEWIFIDTVKSETYSVLDSQNKSLKVLAGQENRKIV